MIHNKNFFRRLSIISDSKRSHGDDDACRTLLVADPDFIEFRNCEHGKSYKKSIIVRNIDTDTVRFNVESRPLRSAFTIFIESATGGDKEFIVPGMFAKLIVHYRCDSLYEPHEKLVLTVEKGSPVTIELWARRDPPVLSVLDQIFISLPAGAELYGSSSSSSGFSIDYSLTSKTSTTLPTSLESSRSNSNGLAAYYGITQTTFDCKKCFVGEYVIVSTVLKNLGGEGRFFLMSEIDWCAMRVEDCTPENFLIVSPFAIWPAYFTLMPGEQITLDTYFYPDSYGVQTDEFYIIADNCSFKTFEVIGDGLILEPRLLLFDKNVKYQWFQTAQDDLCTILYIDLGSGHRGEILVGYFSITSRCELDLSYRWDLSDELLCPEEYKNTVGRKDLAMSAIRVHPSFGVFQFKSNTDFKIMVNLEKVDPANYRSTLRLIVEDIPSAAVSKKHGFTYEDSRRKRRLCENPVDVVFQSIEIRAKCVIDEIAEKNLNHLDGENHEVDESLLTISLTDMNYFMEIIHMLLDKMQEDLSDAESHISDDVCRFIKGHGTCDCCSSSLTSTAVLRPERPLFVGCESIFLAVLCNKSSTRLRYWWGNALGADHTKIKIKLHPAFDYILPNSSQIIKIKCLPLETGDISSIFIPCQFNGLSSLVFSLECTVQSLSIDLYFPIPPEQCPTNVNSHCRMEWRSDEFISKFDKKSGKIVLTDQKLKHEKLLHAIVLNCSQSLRDSDSDLQSNGESYGNEEAMHSSLDKSTNEDDLDPQDGDSFGGIKFDILDESWIEGCETRSIEENLEVSTYNTFYAELFKKIFRYQPLVVEFHVTPAKSEKKRIYLKNESPIACVFTIMRKNGQLQTDQDLVKDSSQDNDELASMMEIIIEPLKGEISPYGTSFLDITTASNTWGVYTDQIIIKTDLLPPFSFWIRIINDESPISYPMCKLSTKKTPKIRFTVFKHGCSSEDRKVLVENTSNIPLYLNWHCFLIEDGLGVEEPFSITLDMITPFMSMDEFLVANPNLRKAVQKFFSCAFNPYISEEVLNQSQNINESDATKSTDSDILQLDQNYQDEDSLERQFSILKTSEHKSASKTASFSKPRQKISDTEFHVSIVPHFGRLVEDLFIITPQELFLSPKEKRYINIHVNTEKMKMFAGKVSCKACGFIRIPPIFKYKDNMYCRKDGCYLPPTEVHLEITKSLLLANSGQEILDISFRTSKPFHINLAATQREVFCDRSGFVHPGESVEVQVTCSINKSWVDKAIERGETLHGNIIIVPKKLFITYDEQFVQYIELLVKIHLPSVKASTNYLNFGDLFIGDFITRTFDVQNLLDRSQSIAVKPSNNETFTLFPKKALLSGRALSHADTIQVTASFVPKSPGTFKETVEIISKTDGLVAICLMEGRAYMDNGVDSR
ncbi:hypothetical protein QAD02_016000 [Eretmocerus hayati]|uniref:Uncharacterized protein n=1 Tax=Eretmocerus hayati TaxID=131215 RepID=A0ACC2P9U3_9HYME|nr:hypothetical protein QAD02_016000 [Eretmocerus hayati]